MIKSALEHELKRWGSRLRLEILRRDRGVLLGLLLSVMPVPPLALAGIAIDLINLRLLSSGRLPPQERQLVRVSLGMGIACTIVSIGLSIGMVMLAERLRHGSFDIIARLFHQFAAFSDYFFEHDSELFNTGREFRQL